MAEQQLDLFGNPIQEIGDLKRDFGANPFTIFDTKDGMWQAKKRKWISLGIKSEVGRDAVAFHTKQWVDEKRSKGEMKGNKLPSNTSIFDPVLCEIMYRWYCPNGGKILDPFAGGSVRGIVAKYLGYDYYGIELREEQVKSNYEQACQVFGCGLEHLPTWVIGDSNKELDRFKDENFDLVFTCPPYVNMEKYSDLDADISNMKYDDFIFTLESIMRKSCKKLKKGGNLIIVVGEVRDKNGNYYGFVPDVVKIIQKVNGMAYYNEAILYNSLASCAIRAAGNMKSGKLVKVHQNILMFKKIG